MPSNSSKHLHWDKAGRNKPIIWAVIVLPTSNRSWACSPLLTGTTILFWFFVCTTFSLVHPDMIDCDTIHLVERTFAHKISLIEPNQSCSQSIFVETKLVGINTSIRQIVVLLTSKLGPGLEAHSISALSSILHFLRFIQFDQSNFAYKISLNEHSQSINQRIW